MFRLHLFLLIFLIVFLVGCSHRAKHHGSHHFDNAKKWEKVFEKDQRDLWQKPMEVFKAVGIKKDSLVADIGSATGYFPVRLAKVASKGRVWGIDVAPSMVNFLNQRARQENLSNLFSILATPADPLIPEPVDFIFMVNTYHHINAREKYFESLINKLKDSGKLVIIDFKKQELPFGPPVDMKLSRDEITKELINAGYSLIKSHDILTYQNLLVFQVLN